MADNGLTLEQMQQTYGQVASAKEIFYDWGGANTDLFKFINSIHNPNYDAFMQFATQIGNKHFFVLYLIVLGLYALGSIFLEKILQKGGVKNRVIMWMGTFIVMIASFLAYLGIVYWCKEYFGYARPYVLVESAIQIETKNAADAYRSFPSGHATFISLIIFSLWPMLSSHMKIFGLGVIGLVAWSRIALGVHFPADVVWGFVLAFFIVYFLRVIIYNLLLKLFGVHCGGA